MNQAALTAASHTAWDLAASRDAHQQAEEACRFIRSRWPRAARAGVVLGTGQGSLTRHMRSEVSLAYEDIPYFAHSTALSHAGRLHCGKLAGRPAVMMAGRFHLYEGYSIDQATLPVRVMQALGVELIILCNASGGLNPRFSSGDIMIVEDHVNLMFASPLADLNGELRGAKNGPVYDLELIERAETVARREDFPVQRGVYVAVRGPCYETRAEYRLLRALGGDVVGMSTVPEAAVAHHLGMRVMALSTVANVATPDNLQATSGEQVAAAAEKAGAKLSKIVRGVLEFAA